MEKGKFEAFESHVRTGNLLIGYVYTSDNTAYERVNYIAREPEAVAAWLGNVSFGQYAIITDVMDLPFIEYQVFIMNTVPDQKFLQKMLPNLVAYQTGEKKPPKEYAAVDKRSFDEWYNARCMLDDF